MMDQFSKASFARARSLVRVCAFTALFIFPSYITFGVSLPKAFSGCGAEYAPPKQSLRTFYSPRKRTLLAMCLQPLPAWILSSSSGKLKISLSYPVDRMPLAPSAGDLSLPCGKCAGCLKDSSSRWVVRMQCELLSQPCSSFITLTYNDEHLPVDNLPVKSHLQNFIKRLRMSSRDYGAKFDRLRYFCVSEHGHKGTFRLHYHALIFGVDFFQPPWNGYLHHVQPDGHPLYTSDLLAKVWSHGFVSFDVATPASAGYLGKYLIKSRDASEIRLFSQRLGLGLFCDFDSSFKPVSFNSIGRQVYSNGFLMLPSRLNAFKVSVPKFLDRYAETFCPDLLLDYKQRKRDFANSFIRRDSSLADYGEYVKVQAGKLKERKLHG